MIKYVYLISFLFNYSSLAAQQFELSWLADPNQCPAHELITREFAAENEIEIKKELNWLSSTKDLAIRSTPFLIAFSAERYLHTRFLTDSTLKALASKILRALSYFWMSSLLVPVKTAAQQLTYRLTEQVTVSDDSKEVAAAVTSVQYNFLIAKDAVLNNEFDLAADQIAMAAISYRTLFPKLSVENKHMLRSIRSTFTNHVKLPLNFSESVLSSISSLLNDSVDMEASYKKLLGVWLRNEHLLGE